MQADDPYAATTSDDTTDTAVSAAPLADPAVAARAAILGRSNKLRESTVTVPEWASDALPNGDVLLIETNGGQRADLLQAATNDGVVIMRVIYPDLVIACARHPLNRELLFSAADRDALNEDSGSALETVATAAAVLCGMQGKDSVKAAVGNSEPTPSEGSPST